LKWSRREEERKHNQSAFIREKTYTLPITLERGLIREKTYTLPITLERGLWPTGNVGKDYKSEQTISTIRNHYKVEMKKPKTERKLICGQIRTVNREL
jgi:hypothetical protein